MVMTRRTEVLKDIRRAERQLAKRKGVPHREALRKVLARMKQ
jgi:hypothetical protein